MLQSMALQRVCILSRVRRFATLWIVAHQASLSFAISQSLLKLMSIESVTPCNHLILCHALLLLPSILPSIRVFSNESVLFIKLSKYWSLSFSFSPSNEYSRLISFRIDWLMKVKEESEKAGLQLNIQKTKIMVSSPITSRQIDGKTVTDYFLGLQNHCGQ